MIRDLLRLTGSSNTNYSRGGGSYANLFDAHPPFQIDGNFGALSGMAEMLLQSQNGDISLLPAIPDAWAEGQISGLKARGNFEVSMKWKDKKITKATISAMAGGMCRIRTAAPVTIKGVSVKSVKTKNGYLTSFNTKKGVTYQITGSAI